MANSTRPGTTGKYRTRPRSRPPSLMSVSSDIAQGLFTKSLHDGDPHPVGTGAIRRSIGILHTGKFHSEARDIDPVASGEALIGGVRPLQEIGDIGQNLRITEREILAQNGEFLVAFRK